MALPFILFFFYIACIFLPLYFSYLPSTFAFVNITTNCALNAGVLSLVVGVGETLNFNIGALLKANNSFLKVGNYRISNFRVPSFLNSSFFEVSGSPLKTSKSGISSFKTPSFPNSSLLEVSRSLFKVTLFYIKYLLRLL